MNGRAGAPCFPGSALFIPQLRDETSECWRPRTQVHRDLLRHVSVVAQKTHMFTQQTHTGASPRVLEFRGAQGLPH